MEEDSEYNDEDESESDDTTRTQRTRLRAVSAISAKALEQIKAVLDAMPEDARKNGVCKSMVENYDG